MEMAATSQAVGLRSVPEGVERADILATEEVGESRTAFPNHTPVGWDLGAVVVVVVVLATLAIAVMELAQVVGA